MFSAISRDYDKFIRIVCNGVYPEIDTDDEFDSLDPNVVDPRSRGITVTSVPQFLNIIRTNAFQKVDIHNTDSRYNHMVDEMVLDLNVYKNPNGVSLHKFNVATPFAFTTQGGGVEGYDKGFERCEKNDDYNGNAGHVIGNVFANSYINRRNEDWYTSKFGKNTGISVENQELMHLPMNKRDKEFNSHIMTCDSARFVYAHRSREEQLPNGLSESFRGSGMFYWYKDKDNLPSAVRQLEYNRLITHFLKESAVPDSGSYYTRGGHNGYKPFLLHVDKILDEYFKGKIIVVDFKRINLTINNDNSKCPILSHYLRNGYRALDREPDSLDIMRSAMSDFSKELNSGNIQFVDGYDYYSKGHEIAREFQEFIDRGFYTEANSRSMVDDGRGDFILYVNKSICLFKTIVIDVEKSGILDQDAVYDPQSGLLFGVLKDPKRSKSRTNIDLYHHPDSEQGKLLTHKPTERGIFYRYINNSPHKQRLYVNANGIVIELESMRDKDLEDGLYVVEVTEEGIEKYKYIHRKTYSRYGVFIRRQDAEDYTAVSDEFIDYVVEDNKLREMFHKVKELNRKENLAERSYEREIAKQELLQEHLERELAIKQQLAEQQMKINKLKIVEEGLKTINRGIDTGIKLAAKGGFGM